MAAKWSRLGVLFYKLHAIQPHNNWKRKKIQYIRKNDVNKEKEKGN